MRTRILPFLVITSFLLPLTTRANDIEPSKEFYTVPRAANPIVLDGDLSEWTGVPVLADPKFYVRNGFEGTPQGKGSGGTNATLVLFEQYQGGIWTGPDDQTSAVQIVYDADNVYFGFVVTDDYHQNANSAWNGDSVQLMIANSNRTTQVALYNYAIGGTEENLGATIIHHEAGAPGQPAPGVTEAVVVRNTNTHRTTYEIKLPKEALGLTSLAGGPQFGLGMAINDGDLTLPGQADQSGQKGWGGLGAHSIVFGKTPSETALITLTRGNDIEPGKEFYTASPAPNPIVLDGVLDEWTGVPVLADPKFYVRNGFEGTPQGKGSAGVNATLVLFEQYQGGIWTGPDDQTSAVQIVYDADNVYFGFVVTDDYHQNANSAWNGDSVQLMIANSNRTAQVALYNYAIGGTEDALGATIIHHEAGAPGQPAPGVTEAFVSRNTNTHRTTYEIKLPVAAIGMTAPLTIGNQLGLGMAINDGDLTLPGQPDQGGQKGWGGLGAHSIVFGKTPSETAQVTLGTAGGGNDRLFFSAINPTIDNFRFRVNDRGAAVLDESSVRITIDGQTFTPVASPKMLDATDFTYTPPRPFFPNTSHSYSIRATDTLGTTITDSGTFFTPPYAYLDASDKVTPKTDEPGFLWNIHQNESFTANSISRALHQLAGLLGPNLADPDARGHTFLPSIAGPTANHPIIFEPEEVLNVNQDDGTAGGDFSPDSPMPGLGPTTQKDGIAVEIMTYLDLTAGRHTLIVNSDDGFRTIAGHVNDLFLGQVAGQFDQPTGRGAADTAYDIRVQEDGTYAFRTIYQEGTDAASIEWKSLKEDGTEVLLNDRVNGGIPAWRRVTAGLRTGINMVSPLPGATDVPGNTRIFASIREGATTVDLNSVRLRLDGNLVTVSPTRFVEPTPSLGNLVTVNYQPPSALAAMQHTAILSYMAGGVGRTQSWSFTSVAPIVLAIQRSGGQIQVSWSAAGAVLQESTDLITWTDLSAATSPYTATPDPRAMVFYRLKR